MILFSLKVSLNIFTLLNNYMNKIFVFVFDFQNYIFVPSPFFGKTYFTVNQGDALKPNNLFRSQL